MSSRCFQEAYLIELRIRCTTHVWTTLWGHTRFDRVGKTGETVTADDQHVVETPVLQFVRTPNQNLAPSSPLPTTNP